MSNIECRLVIRFFTWKDLNATEISKELDECRQRPCSVVKCFAQFKYLQHAFEHSPQADRPSTITTHQNIQAVEQIGMHDRKTSVHRLACELPIPTTTVYEIINNHLGMKKVSTRWVPNTYSTLSRESEGNPINYFHRIVTGDEI